MRRIATWAAPVSLLMVLTITTSAAGSGPLTAGTSPAPSPTLAATPAAIRQVALGVSMLPEAGIGDLGTFQQFSDDSGRPPAIWSIWRDWAGSSRFFPKADFLNAISNGGATVPMIIWQPNDPLHLESPKYRYSQIIAGNFDPYIKKFALAAKAWGGRVIIRFAHEMNGNWFPWGMGRFDNTPQRFIKAWKHVVGIFRGSGKNSVHADNVRFLWSPSAPCGKCTGYGQLYPGDKYVSYVGFTAFNWSKPQPWHSMVDKFTPSMKALKKVTGRPVIVAETGSSSIGGKKPGWIRTGYPAVYKTFPKIRAIVYFNVDKRDQRQPDWRLTTPAAALTAYQGILARPEFQGTIP